MNINEIKETEDIYDAKRGQEIEKHNTCTERNAIRRKYKIVSFKASQLAYA